MILDILNPDYRFSSVTGITPEWLQKKGYDSLLLDIDNTLLPRNSSVVPEKYIVWLKNLQKQGIVLVLSSNNGGKRIRQIKAQLQENALDIPVLTWAGKPIPLAYRRACRVLYETAPEKTSIQVLAVGDQLFTDVLGAHLCNLPAAWLQPLSQNDFITTKLLRVFEKQLMQYFDKKGILPNEN